MDEYQTARRVAGKLRGAGFEAYIIGGAARDLLFGRHPKDFDLATNATPEEIKALLKLGESAYKDTAQAYGVTRVKVGGQMLEIATFRRDVGAHKGRRRTKVEFARLEDDLARRDFTINALALDPLTNQVIDYEGGLDDIQRKTIRFIGQPAERIKEDPLRILRAIRLRNVLTFAYAPGTIEAIRSAVEVGAHRAIATDRLRQELTMMLVHPSRRQALEDLDYFGLLESILPEVTAGKLIQQPKQFHAEGDVWTHQLLVMEALPPSPSRQLVWAALLHDVGKAKTQTLPTTKEDRIRFNRHYEISADMAREILERLHFSKRDIDTISWMVFHHINIDDLPKMKTSRQQKMLNHPAFSELLELHKADAAACWKTNKLKHKPQFKDIEKIWRQYLSKSPEEMRPSIKRDLGIDGNWLSLHFPELEPGPKFRQVLSRLQEDYLDRGIRQQDHYLKLTKKILKTED